MNDRPTPQTDNADARLDQLLTSTHQAVGDAVHARLDAQTPAPQDTTGQEQP